MRASLKDATKSFSGALLADIVAASVTLLLVLVIPKFLGIQDFSYWQLYVFYTSYVGLMHFGWADGIYLRYGGRHYIDLDKRLLSSQFWLLFITQLIIFACFIFFAVFAMNDTDKALIVAMTGLNFLLLNTRTLLQFVLQSTNRIIVFSKSLIVEKSVFITLALSVLVAGFAKYEYLLAADIAAKTIMLIILCFVCRDIVLTRASNVYVGIKEAAANISVGVKLMFANVASLLVIGVVRFGIERSWDIETFGKISLTLTIANLAMIFINAASVVIFPIIKRASKSSLPGIYISLRTILMATIFGMMILYYPVHYALSIWLPDYSDSLIYMALLFPISVYESKMSMLINTYLKAMRKEKYILTVNVVAVMLSIIGTSIAALWLHSLTTTILVIVAVLAMRAILAEYALAKMINIDVRKDILLEVLMTVAFIALSWYIKGVMGAMLYIVLYIVYILIKYPDIKKMIEFLKKAE